MQNLCLKNSLDGPMIYKTFLQTFSHPAEMNWLVPVESWTWTLYSFKWVNNTS